MSKMDKIRETVFAAATEAMAGKFGFLWDRDRAVEYPEGVRYKDVYGDKILVTSEITSDDVVILRIRKES